MRYIFVAVLVSFVSASNALATIRTWTSADGKTVEAEYVKLSLNKVILKKSNGHTIAVPMSYLSEDDQIYVSKMVQPQKKPESSLSKSVIRKIVDNYETLSKKNMPGRGIPSVYYGAHLNPEQQHGVVGLFGSKERSCYNRPSLEGRVVDQVRFKSSNFPYIFIRIDFKPASRKISESYSEMNSWIYLLDNGTIKYDPLYYPHPVEVAFERIRSLIFVEHNIRRDGIDAESRKSLQDQWDENLEIIVASGIPIFGLNTNQTASDRKESLEMFIAWLRNDAANWDCGDPIIPIHEDAYKELLDAFEDVYKSI